MSNGTADEVMPAWARELTAKIDALSTKVAALSTDVERNFKRLETEFDSRMAAIETRRRGGLDIDDGRIDLRPAVLGIDGVNGLGPPY